MMAFWGGGLITNPHKGDFSPWKVQFSSCFGHKRDVDFNHFALDQLWFSKDTMGEDKLFWILNFSWKWTSEKVSLTKIYYLSWIFCKFYQF